MGVLPRKEALRIASERELDLVEIAPQANPPVCKIIDYGKFIYEQQKREKQQKKTQTQTSLKEVRFKAGTDTHDFDFKTRHAREFLVAAALGSDPSQAASCTSAAIARELVPDIADIARRADMDEARRAKLEASIARIDRRDAFGFRASLVAERARVADQLRSLDDGSEQFDRDLRRRNAEWIMAARIELGRVHAPIENPGALESIDDLFPAERLKTARVSSDAIAEHLQRQWRARNEEDGKAAKGRNPLATLPVEPIRDPATDATEAQATLSALDAALKPRAPAR